MTQNGVLIIEVSAIQWSFNTLQYNIGTQNGVLIIGFLQSEVCNREVVYAFVQRCSDYHYFCCIEHKLICTYVVFSDWV